MIKRKYILFCFLTVIPILQLTAQRINGIVIDKVSQQNIPFVNIWISSTTIGTITNEDGRFELDRYSQNGIDSINFSHIGYLPFRKDVSNIHKTDTLIISLIPINSIIDEVTVIGTKKPITAKKVIKHMQSEFFNNYSPFAYEGKGFYREGIKGDEDYVGFGEAIYDLHFEGANKKYLNHKVLFFPSGWYRLQEIRRSNYFIDITYRGRPRTNLMIRTVFGYEKTLIYNIVLDNSFSRKMDLKIVSDTIDSNLNPIYIIEGISNKRDNYSGVKDDNPLFSDWDNPDKILLYISSLDWSLKQIEVFKDSKTNPVIIPGTLLEKIDGETHLTIRYEKQSNYYRLNYISFKRSFYPLGWGAMHTGFNKIEEQVLLFFYDYKNKILSIDELEQKYNKKIISDMGIRYAINLEEDKVTYNASFWNKFNTPIKNVDYNKILIDMKQKSHLSLITQFNNNTNKNFLLKKNFIKLIKNYEKELQKNYYSNTQ